MWRTTQPLIAAVAAAASLAHPSPAAANMALDVDMVGCKPPGVGGQQGWFSGRLEITSGGAVVFRDENVPLLLRACSVRLDVQFTPELLDQYLGGELLMTVERCKKNTGTCTFRDQAERVAGPAPLNNLLADVYDLILLKLDDLHETVRLEMADAIAAERAARIAGDQALRDEGDAAYIQNQTGFAQPASLRMDGTIRLGSEITGEPPDYPDSGLIMRRIRSVKRNAGLVIVRDDEILLKRDGTDGGFLVEGNDGSHGFLRCLGLTADGQPANRVMQVFNQETKVLYSNSQGVVYMSCAFGQPARHNGTSGHNTHLELFRDCVCNTPPCEYPCGTWIGTVISTWNQ